MARQRIINANSKVGQRGGREERPGLREFSDRYQGPQMRLRTESERSNSPQSERSVSQKGAISRSEENKQALTAPRLATERVTVEQAPKRQQARSEANRQSRPESSAAEQRAEVVETARTPRLRETFGRDVAAAPASAETRADEDTALARRRAAR